MSDAGVEPTARRLAEAVLAGDAVAALALADLVLETFHAAGAGRNPRLRVVDAGFSVRARKACLCVCAGVTSFYDVTPPYFEATLADVAGRAADELLGVRNCGLTTLAEVRARLGRHGLRLRGDLECVGAVAPLDRRIEDLGWSGPTMEAPALRRRLPCPVST